MRDPDFRELAERLLDAGIQPRIAQRAIVELQDHYADLVAAARQENGDDCAAREQAARELGDPDLIVAAMAAERELKVWAYRYPRVALVVYPLACLAALPAVPVVAGVNHASTVARWGTSLLAAALLTLGLLLVLQLSILFG